MTQEDKELLLKDLCARLPHGVKCAILNKDLGFGGISGFEGKYPFVIDGITQESDNIDVWVEHGNFSLETVKLYLFPLSSMNEKQKKELENLGWNFDNFEIHNVSECLGTYREYVAHSDCFNLIDWLDKNHFDYRGLIEKGLAIDATGKNIY